MNISGGKKSLVYYSVHNFRIPRSNQQQKVWDFPRWFLAQSCYLRDKEPQVILLQYYKIPLNWLKCHMVNNDGNFIRNVVDRIDKRTPNIWSNTSNDSLVTSIEPNKNAFIFNTTSRPLLLAEFHLRKHGCGMENVKHTDKTNNRAHKPCLSCTFLQRYCSVLDTTKRSFISIYMDEWKRNSEIFTRKEMRTNSFESKIFLYCFMRWVMRSMAAIDSYGFNMRWKQFRKTKWGFIVFPVQFIFNVYFILYIATLLLFSMFHVVCVS